MNLCELPQPVIQADLNLSQFTLSDIVNGISKKVYLITDHNNKKIMLYIWLNPYPGLTETHIDGEQYLYAEGLSYFCHNTKLLTDIGLRVPQILKTGHFSDCKEFDYAYVECLNGTSLQEYLQNGCFADIRDKFDTELTKFHACSRNHYGSPLLSQAYSKSCSELCYEHALEELEIACKLDNDANKMKSLILQQLQKYIVLPDCQTKPASYTLIHGELSPSHVWLLTDGTIAFIDIEGIKFFDVEFEYAFIDILYGYLGSKPKSYNRNKLLFYKLYHHICWLSVSIDYLRHIDETNEFFKKLRYSVLKELYGR